MKKRLLLVFSILILLGNSAFAEIKEPQWWEFCPTKYYEYYSSVDSHSLLYKTTAVILGISIVGLPISIPMTLDSGKRDKINYWVYRKNQFYEALSNCNAMNSDDNKIYCFADLKKDERYKNEQLQPFYFW